jgi:predicted AlkP superfamily phosphohydrolase/phosphomutase
LGACDRRPATRTRVDGLVRRSGDAPSAPIALLGFDALGWESLRPFLDEGDLPHLGALIARGASGPLASVAYPSSAAAWSACMTGLDPGKTGVLTYEVSRAGSYATRVLTAAHRSGVPFWRSLEGRRVVVAGIPSFAAEPVDGVTIAGPFAGRGSATFPAPLAAALTALGLDGDPLDDILNAEGVSDDERFDAALTVFRNRGRLAVALHRLCGADVFVFVFLDTDRLLSRYFADTERRRAVSRVVDEIVGEFMALLPPAATLLVVSDHGLRSYRRNFNPFRWLHDHGWLNGGAGDRAQAVESLELRRQAGSRVRYLAWQVLRRLPRRDSPLLRRLPIPRFIRVARGPQVQPVVWPATRAYPFPSWRFPVSLIRLNVAGREPGGVVRPGAEAEGLQAEIRQALLGLRDPSTGARVVEAVSGRDELFAGPRVSEFAELFYRLAPPYCAGSLRDFRGPLFYDEAEPRACHSHEGVLLAAGPGIEPGTKVAAQIADVAPTVLHLAGVPIDTYLDGEPCLDMFREAFRAATPVRRVDSDYAELITRQATEIGTEDDAYVREQLRKLGYL